MKKDDVIWLEIHEPYDFVTLFGFDPIQIRIFSELKIGERTRILFTCQFDFKNTNYGFGYMNARYTGYEISNELKKSGQCIAHGHIVPKKYMEDYLSLSTKDALAFFANKKFDDEIIGFIGAAQTYPTRKR